MQGGLAAMVDWAEIINSENQIMIPLFFIFRKR